MPCLWSHTLSITLPITIVKMDSVILKHLPPRAVCCFQILMGLCLFHDFDMVLTWLFRVQRDNACSAHRNPILLDDCIS